MPMLVLGAAAIDIGSTMHMAVVNLDADDRPALKIGPWLEETLFDADLGFRLRAD